LGDGAKKARNQAILLVVVCLLLVTLGAEGLTAIFESGKDFGQWLSGLF
jgi:pspC domain protein